MKIPPNFKDILPIPLETLRQLAQVVGQPQLLNKLKEAAEFVGGKDSSAMESIQQAFQQAGKWAEVIAEATGLSPNSNVAKSDGINATGEIFTSRWTNGTVAEQTALVAGRLLANPKLSDLDVRSLNSLVIGLSGASDALIAVNTSAALHALAISESEKRSWILPRVDCVRPFRFGTANTGSIRAPLDQAKCSVIEAGTSTECSSDDIRFAAKETSPIFLTVSVPKAHLSEQDIAHRNSIRASRNELGGTWIEVLFNGSFHALESAPNLTCLIEDRWNDGPDILLVPTDLWIGGPEACLVLTRDKNAWWSSLEQTLQASGLEASAWTQSVLLQVLKATEARINWEQSGIGAIVSNSIENQRFRARKIISQLDSLPDVESASILEKDCRIGMGVWSDAKLPTIAISIKPRGISSSALLERLNRSLPPASSSSAASSAPQSGASESSASGQSTTSQPTKDDSKGQFFDHVSQAFQISEPAKELWCNVLSDSLEIVMLTVSPSDDAAIVQKFLALSNSERKTQPDQSNA